MTPRLQALRDDLRRAQAIEELAFDAYMKPGVELRGPELKVLNDAAERVHVIALMMREEAKREKGQ